MIPKESQERYTQPSTGRRSRPPGKTLFRVGVGTREIKIRTGNERERENDCVSARSRQRKRRHGETSFRVSDKNINPTCASRRR